MNGNQYDAMVEKLANEMVEGPAEEEQGADMDLSQLPPEVIEQILAEQEAAEGGEQEEIDLSQLPPEVIQQILAEQAAMEEAAVADQAEEMPEEEEVTAGQFTPEQEKLAQEVAQNAVYRAAAMYKEAQAIEQAAKEALEEAQLYKDASAEVFSRFGLMEK